MALPDVQYEALIAQGYSGALPDMMTAWKIDNGIFSTLDLYNALFDLGYTGALPDMLLSFWEDGGTFNTWLTSAGLANWNIADNSSAWVIV